MSEKIASDLLKGSPSKLPLILDRLGGIKMRKYMFCFGAIAVNINIKC